MVAVPWSKIITLARMSWLFNSPRYCPPIAIGPTIVGPPGREPPTVGESVNLIPAMDCDVEASGNVCVKVGAAAIPSHTARKGLVVIGPPPPPPGRGFPTG